MVVATRRPRLRTQAELSRKPRALAVLDASSLDHLTTYRLEYAGVSHENTALVEQYAKAAAIYMDCLGPIANQLNPNSRVIWAEDVKRDLPDRVKIVRLVSRLARHPEEYAEELRYFQSLLSEEGKLTRKLDAAERDQLKCLSEEVAIATSGYWRTVEYPLYKGQRMSTPNSLMQQVQAARRGMRYASLGSLGYEADDAASVVVQKWIEDRESFKDFDFLLVWTTDADWLGMVRRPDIIWGNMRQSVDQPTFLRNTDIKGWAEYQFQKKKFAKWKKERCPIPSGEVDYNFVIDLKVLTGDDSDNYLVEGPRSKNKGRLKQVPREWIDTLAPPQKWNLYRNKEIHTQLQHLLQTFAKNDVSAATREGIKAANAVVLGTGVNAPVQDCFIPDSQCLVR